MTPRAVVSGQLKRQVTSAAYAPYDPRFFVPGYEGYDPRFYCGLRGLRAEFRRAFAQTRGNLVGDHGPQRVP